MLVSASKYWGYVTSKVMHMNRFLKEIKRLFIRKHFREINFSYSTLALKECWKFLPDIIVGLIRGHTVDMRAVTQFERAVEASLNVKYAISFGGGREAFKAILLGMGIGKGDEVILPGFTCAVVPYAVQHIGARPVYVDIGMDYRMDLNSLRNALNPRTKAILVQHTFGIPDRIREIKAIAEKAGIFVIEDCAHTIGAVHEGRSLGSWGDAAFFSFEVTKALTSGWGGIAVTSNQVIADSLNNTRASIPTVSRLLGLRTAIQIFSAVFLYHPNVFGLGRLVLALMYRLNIFAVSIPKKQREGVSPDPPFRRLTALQALILQSQMLKLSSINDRRSHVAQVFSNNFHGIDAGQPLLRYPLQVFDRYAAVNLFRKYQIELGEWFQAPLHPADCDLVGAQYEWGSCPVAEQLSSGCINLPTFINDLELERVLFVAKENLRLIPLGENAGSGKKK